MNETLKNLLQEALEEEIFDHKLHLSHYDNWDSLVGMVIVDKLETHFNFNISVAELEDNSLESLKEKIVSNGIS